MSDSQARLIVMVSSTFLDLPEHRKEAFDACLRLGMTPVGMEFEPSRDADSTQVSFELVDTADIYVLLLANRYGQIAHGEERSLTELEFWRATQRGIPRLAFVMHEDHPVHARDVEVGEGAAKLKTFREGVKTLLVGRPFRSKEELRAEVLHALIQYRREDSRGLHSLRSIPLAPEPYVAHPYTLLQTQDLAGRKQELSLLDSWIDESSGGTQGTRIFNLIAIGGMGKSAVAWKWFNDHLPRDTQPLAGRVWWSFYESDATFENFVLQTLAYVTGRETKDIGELALREREDLLLGELARRSFLLVLDGLERILVAYARWDAARLSDDDLDERTGNAVEGALGLPPGTAESITSRHQLRKTADPRAGDFLRRLVNARATRVLITSRLYPADLQAVSGRPLSGSTAYFLLGLQDRDALDLWYSYGVSGSTGHLLEVFQSVGNYPLLIRALAGEVANYRRAPGDFDRWRADHPEFKPSELPLVQRKSHVLAFALLGLNETIHSVLQTIAGFRIPATYMTLVAVLIDSRKLLAEERELDSALIELEDRGLVGWDRVSNRYDLHPIVRSIVWSSLDQAVQTGIYQSLESHFRSLPPITKVSSIDDLARDIELFHTLIGLGKLSEAYSVLFSRRVEAQMLYTLSCVRELAELIEAFLPNGLEKLPNLSKYQVINLVEWLAVAYDLSGRPSLAERVYRQAISLVEREHGVGPKLSENLGNLADCLRNLGLLLEAERCVERAIAVPIPNFDGSLKAANTRYHALILATRGESNTAVLWLDSFDALQHLDEQNLGVLKSFHAITMLLAGRPAEALELAREAEQLAAGSHYPRDLIRALRVQGSASLRLLIGKSKAADLLQRALAKARSINFVEEELAAVIDLAELERQEGNLGKARDLLNDSRELMDRGPYPLLLADALNTLARVTRDAGDLEGAITHAEEAYRLAWCDGPPYSYQNAIQEALTILPPSRIPKLSGSTRTGHLNQQG